MARAWPFEGRPEAGGARPESFRTPNDFVSARGRDVDAVIVRIGLHDAQLVLIDDRGSWERWVYHSVDEAEAAARRLGIGVHVGQFPEDTRVRMNAFQRPPEDFVLAYPEQGQVGPVIPYPENRPREVLEDVEESSYRQ